MLMKFAYKILDYIEKNQTRSGIIAGLMLALIVICLPGVAIPVAITGSVEVIKKLASASLILSIILGIVALLTGMFFGLFVGLCIAFPAIVKHKNKRK